MEKMNWWRVDKIFTNEDLQINLGITKEAKKSDLDTEEDHSSICNICQNEKYDVIFGCHRSHVICTECLIEWYFRRGNTMSCLACYKPINWKKGCIVT